jgi:hypothetical protein
MKTTETVMDGICAIAWRTTYAGTERTTSFELTSCRKRGSKGKGREHFAAQEDIAAAGGIPTQEHGETKEQNEPVEQHQGQVPQQGALPEACFIGAQSPALIKCDSYAVESAEPASSGRIPGTQRDLCKLSGMGEPSRRIKDCFPRQALDELAGRILPKLPTLVPLTKTS